MSKRTAIRDLSCAAIEVKPRNHSWSEGYGDTWEYWEACNCSECKAIVLGREGDELCHEINRVLRATAALF